MACPACDHPGAGYQHCCAGSGTFLAAEAHDSGELEPLDTLPVFRADFQLRLRALDEPACRVMLTELVRELLDADSVLDIELTIQETVAA